MEIPRNNLSDCKSQISILKLILEEVSNQYTLNFDLYILKFLNENKFANNKCYYEKLNQGVVDNNLTKHPKFNEFCTRKNKINPKCIAMGSKMQVWWKCKSGIDHSWQENPNNRKFGGCPFCSNKRVSITNRLDVLEPKTIQLWSNKNKVKIYNYTNRNSVDSIVWNCTHCKNNFLKKIDRMVDTKGYCPHCKNYNLK